MANNPSNDSYYALRDQNRVAVATGQSNTDSTQTLPFLIDSITGRLLVSSTGGSGVTVLTVTGTINDLNVTFTTTSLPTLLAINGGFYQQSGGSITWSYLAGTITLSSPVGTGGSIFGVS